MWGEARGAEGPPGPPIWPAKGSEAASLYLLIGWFLSCLLKSLPQLGGLDRAALIQIDGVEDLAKRLHIRQVHPEDLLLCQRVAMQRRAARAVRERSDTRRPGTEKRPRVLFGAVRSPRSRDFRRCRVVFLSRSSVFFFAASTMLSFAPVIAAICAERRLRTRGCEARYGRGVLAVWRTHEVHLRLRRLLLLLVPRWGHAALRLRH